MSHREHNRASSDIGGMRGAVPFGGLEHENRQMGDGYVWSYKYNVCDVDNEWSLRVRVPRYTLGRRRKCEIKI